MSETNALNEELVETELTAGARKAFHALMWPGVILLIIAVVVVFMGASEYDEMEQYTYYAVAGGTTQWAIPFVVGAGIVAGLGRRKTARVSRTGTVGEGAYVPAAD